MSKRNFIKSTIDYIVGTDSPESSKQKMSNTDGTEDAEFATICAQLMADEKQPPLIKLLLATIKKITGQMDQLMEQNKRILEENTMLKSLSQAPNWENQYYDHRHNRSVVVSGLKESTLEIASKRLEKDEEIVQKMLDVFDIEVRPLAVFRMGKKMAEKPRLLKIEFASRSVVSKIMTRKKAMSKHDDFKRVYIRPSMSFEDRQKRKQLQNECTEMNKQNPSSDPSQQYVIYANKIIKRSEIVRR